MHTIKKHAYEYSVTLPVSFHDTDAMGVIWHGNYLKYFEIAREGLFNEHGLDYTAMEKSGYVYPVIEEKIRYPKAITAYSKQLKVRAYLEEVLNRVKVGFEVYNEQDELCAFGYTIQVAVKQQSHELCLEVPIEFSRCFPELKN